MEYNKHISQMQVGDVIENYFLLKSATIKTSSNGKTFLSAVLSDESGSIDMKVWDFNGQIATTDEGGIIKVRGEITEYKGNKQIIGQRLRMANENDKYDLSTIVPVAPINEENTVQYLKNTVASLEDSDYRTVCEVMLDRHIEAFRKIPAAKSVHHSFLSGLLMHTANMVETADFLSDLYQEVIDRNLLIAGTLLHDFAKEQEFVLSKMGIVTDYSVKGQLLGHLVMGAQEVARIAEEQGIPEEKSVLLQHMILSHHGEPEFGAAVKPQCAESELLSYIDMIDSRMEIYAETFQNMPAGTFSDRLFSLDKKIYRHK